MLEVVFHDEYFVAVNKPAGMLVHRSWLDKHETQFVMRALCVTKLGSMFFRSTVSDEQHQSVLIFALSSEVASQVMLCLLIMR